MIILFFGKSSIFFDSHAIIKTFLYGQASLLSILYMQDIQLFSKAESFSWKNYMDKGSFNRLILCRLLTLGVFFLGRAIFSVPQFFFEVIEECGIAVLDT